MSWLAKVLAHFRRKSADPAAVHAVKVLAKADRVIEDYRKADAALELRIVRRPR